MVAPFSAPDNVITLKRDEKRLELHKEEIIQADDPVYDDLIFTLSL